MRPAGETKDIISTGSNVRPTIVPFGFMSWSQSNDVNTYCRMYIVSLERNPEDVIISVDDDQMFDSFDYNCNSRFPSNPVFVMVCAELEQRQGLPDCIIHPHQQREQRIRSIGTLCSCS